jgi:signal transduction histidine kinase
LIDALGAASLSEIVGGRPGELFHCAHAAESEGGCGTTAFCRYCGAVNAILQSQQGSDAVEECRILSRHDCREEALDLRVWAKPFQYRGEEFSFFSIVNIADEKRRIFLERIFLHDIMNTASALRGFSEMIGEEAVDAETRKAFVEEIGFLSNKIIDEINAHRTLLAAEHNELKVQVKSLDTLGLLRGIIKTYNRPEMLDRRILRLDGDSVSVAMESDETLLGRVLGNMTKNAIEASMPGETITLGCIREGDRVSFFVRNPTYIPENIRAQIFNRSFSTKGSGRGLGTYSMKYLTEKYLKGRIGFTTSETEGTTFTALYPLRFDDAP